MKTEIPWICDSMDNTVKLAFGPEGRGAPPNGEFVLDPEGKVVRKYFWSNPARLRKDLGELVGASKTVTKVEDLPFRFQPEPRTVASGVVKPLKLPAGLQPLKITPQESPQPYFAKLRAEATRSVMQSGRGKLYLSVNLDPLYKVHWNNEAGKVSIAIKVPKGVTVTPADMQSGEVKAKADVDPRQFLVDIGGTRTDEPLEISVTYIACDDAETFCSKVTQNYTVMLSRDAHGGSRPGIFMPRMFARVRDLDKNKDGKLSRDELPAGQKTLFIGHMDYNGNETIESDEIDRFMKMFNNGRGFQSSKNDGAR